MNLNINFNGIQANPSIMSAAIGSAGNNSSFSINGVHIITDADVTSIINAAGDNIPLVLNYNGAQALTSRIQHAASLIGDESSVEVNTAQSISASDLASIASSAGDRKLSVEFNGGQTTASVVQQFLGIAASNTTTLLNTAQAFSQTEISAIANSAGSKKYNPTFNGAQLSLADLQTIVNAAGVNTSISVNTAQSFGNANWTSILNILGDKELSANFDGDIGPTANAIQVLDHSSPNTSVSINTAQSLGSSNLSSILAAANDKSLSLNFNGTYTSASMIQQALSSSGDNTVIICSNFQHFSNGDVSSILASVGGKNFIAIIDGGGTTEAFVNSVLNAAGPTTTITLDTAQAFNPAQLESFIQTAG